MVIYRLRKRPDEIYEAKTFGKVTKSVRLQEPAGV
jgi:hypothetical protein